MTHSLLTVRNKALDYLSRREHSRLELQKKLLNKGFAIDLIDSVLTQLQGENLLSETRFIENFLYARINQGYGPLRIQQELRQRGISEDLTTEWLNVQDTEWLTRARHARQKRFGQCLPHTLQDKAKQIRFLQYRGFTNTQIKMALSQNSMDNEDE